MSALATGLMAWGLGTGAVPCDPELFRVSRSTNANVVAYEVRRAPDGALDAQDPVHPVWLMDAEDGRREELTALESALAYGVDPVEGEGIQVALRARPDFVIRVATRNGCPVALARVGGREARLRRIAVAVGGGLLPSVLHVEVTGTDPVTGEQVVERLTRAD